MNITIRQNTTNRAISQYKNFFFDRGVVTVGSNVYGLNCGNLCQIGADTDDGTNIDAEAQTGMIEFAEGEKRVRSFHVQGSYNSYNALEVSYAMDGLTSVKDYTKTTASQIGSGGGGSLKFQGQRAKRGDHLSLILKNVSGAGFMIKKITTFLIRGCRR